jgi:hypothetical protein
MKKLFVVLLALVVIGVFAFGQNDPRFAVSVYATGSIASGASGGDVDFFKIDNTDQKDSDLLTFSYNADGKAGANFRLYTKLADDTSVDSRKLNLWFKPVDTLKVSIGEDIQSGLYTEQIQWWHVTDVAAFSSAGWSSDANFGGAAALALQITAIPNLTIDLGVSPGAGNWFLPAGEASGNTDYGIVAKYKVEGFGSFGAAFRNDGDGETKFLRGGLDVTMVPGLYAFETVIARFDGDFALEGVAFDTYAKYTAGNFYAALYLPVVLRLTGDTGDDSYLRFDLKTGYKLSDNFTPFIRFQQDGDEGSAKGINFGDVAFSPNFGIGADYTIQKVSFTTYIGITLADGEYASFNIPFSARISF